MGNFRYRMLQFMIGRNGFDAFCRGLLFLAMILIIADIFIPGRIVRYIGLAIMFYSYFRAFSRNIARRSAENSWYISCVELPLQSYMRRDRKIISILNVPPADRCSGLPREEGA